MPVNFSVPKQETKIIAKIAKRAVKLATKEAKAYGYDEQWAKMDVTACHTNGNPLKLQKLLEADDFNFLHDVFGIARHINRDTGKLENCFLPRFSA